MKESLLKPAQIATRALIGLACAFAANIVTGQDVSARNLYVSPAGSGTTGQTWATAWKDTAQIDWTKVAPGDHVVLDGGASGITYKSSLTVPVSNIVIRQANSAGHSGQVILSGNVTPLPIATGVKFTGSNIHLVAVRRSGIKISQFGAEGVNIQTNNNSLRNVEIASLTGFPPYAGGKIAGATFGGLNNHFINCDFRDCGISAGEKLVAGNNTTVFNGCTFGSNGYGFFVNNGTGIQGSKTAGSSIIYAHNCVFGPYVDQGVDIANGTARLTNSLFLSARIANIKVTPPAGNKAVVHVANCTLYQKKLNPMQHLPYGTPEYVVSVNADGKLKVSNSVIWGGTVDVPAAQVINAGGNVQYAVSGNTVALAPTLVDPVFVDTATLSEMVAPSSFIPRTLTTLNFTPTASAAAGKGSPIVKVSDIVAPYGPQYGLPSAVGGP